MRRLAEQNLAEAAAVLGSALAVDYVVGPGRLAWQSG
jgi:hypothetical protein